jgi:hypothetical protein
LGIDDDTIIKKIKGRNENVIGRKKEKGDTLQMLNKGGGQTIQNGT